MLMLPQNTQPRPAQVLRLLRRQEVSSIASHRTVREVECEGEPPFEAVRNSAVC
jgi:hypothetical protein